MSDGDYPHLEQFSRSVGIPAERLVAAFRVESIFHQCILEEPSAEKRRDLYREVYEVVHRLYGKTEVDLLRDQNPQRGLVRLFERELSGRSILEVGCGAGFFLAAVAQQLGHRELVGLDVSIPDASRRHPEIEFVSADVVRFDLGRTFEVVFSNQLLEHIAPADLPSHLDCVRRALEPGGIFIVLLPNRLFGPGDVTRIVDFSYTGRTAARGTHLNESTHHELIPMLEAHGFRDLRTVLPVPGLRNLLRGVRLSPRVPAAVEQSALLMRALRLLRVRGQCMARFGVTIVATAGTETDVAYAPDRRRSARL